MCQILDIKQNIDIDIDIDIVMVIVMGMGIDIDIDIDMNIVYLYRLNRQFKKKDQLMIYINWSFIMM